MILHRDMYFYFFLSDPSIAHDFHFVLSGCRSLSHCVGNDLRLRVVQEAGERESDCYEVNLC